MQSSLKDRVLQQRLRKGIKTQRDLAEMMGISPKHLSGVLNGKAGQNLKNIEKLVTALGTTRSYLLGDTDDPTNNVKGIAVTRVGTLANLNISNNPGEVEEIDSNLAPLNPHHQALIRVLPKAFSASCGWGNDWSWNSEAIDFDFEHTDPDPELARHSPLIGMYVTGESMEPDISEDDMVIFTDNPSEIEFAPNGSIVVVNYEGRMIVRGIFRKGDAVVLRAWNDIYKDIIATPESDFKICGLVLKIYPGPKKPRSML
jgi:SOS-response transcriptional repressor LexA